MTQYRCYFQGIYGVGSTHEVDTPAEAAEMCVNKFIKPRQETETEEWSVYVVREDEIRMVNSFQDRPSSTAEILEFIVKR